MQCQATALGKELDQEKMNHVTNGLNTLKQMRNAENANFGAKSEELWIGGECAMGKNGGGGGVRYSCKQREVMGFVTQGNGFSLVIKNAQVIVDKNVIGK